jgi:hypothetical protein
LPLSLFLPTSFSCYFLFLFCLRSKVLLLPLISVTHLNSCFHCRSRCAAPNLFRSWLRNQSSFLFFCAAPFAKQLERIEKKNYGGRQGALQQHRQLSADPPSPDSTDPKISAFSNVTFTSSKSCTVRTLDLCFWGIT